MIQRWLPSVAIVLGAVTRLGSGMTWVLQPCLMLIMFAAFVETGALRGWRPSWFLGRLLLFQMAAGLLLFLLFRGWLEAAATAGLVLALTPSAVSAAAVASGLRANLQLVTSTIAASNLVACVTLPVAYLSIEHESVSLFALAGPARLVGLTVVIPYVAAFILVRLKEESSGWSRYPLWTTGSRVLWSVLLWVSASKVGDWYWLEAEQTWPDRAWPGLLALGAFGWFSLSSQVLQYENRAEALVCYGHKNSGLALLVTLTGFPIAVAAAVLSYSLVQNVFFSLMLSRRAIRDPENGFQQ